MKAYFIAILFLTLNILFANQDPVLLFDKKLENHQKVVATFSGDFDEKSSIHLALVKNRELKKYEIFTYYISEENDIINLQTNILDFAPEIISYHINHNIISIVAYDKKEKTFLVIDYNLNDKSSKVLHDSEKTKYDNLFKERDKTILVTYNYSNSNKSIDLVFIYNTNKIDKKTIKIIAEFEKAYLKFFENRAIPKAVSKNYFIKHGVIKPSKSYVHENSIVLTYDYERIALTDCMIIDFDTEKVLYKRFKPINPIVKLKSYNSYFHNDILFTIQTSKQDCNLLFYDIHKSHLIRNVTLDNFKSFFKDDKSMENFLKRSSKVDMISTITVNPTVDEKYNILTIDRKSKRNYSFDSNFYFWYSSWFFRNSFNNFNQLSTGFGPKNNYDNDIYDYVFSDYELTIILDSSYDIANNQNIESLYLTLDKNDYKEEFDPEYYKNFSITFVKRDIRYIYYSSSRDKIVIYRKPHKTDISK